MRHGYSFSICMWPMPDGAAAVSTADPMVPRIARVRRRRRDGPDVWTLDLEPEETNGAAFTPGQFNMVTVFGIGEAPISFSGDPPAQPRRNRRATWPVRHRLAAGRDGRTRCG